MRLCENTHLGERGNVVNFIKVFLIRVVAQMPPNAFYKERQNFEHACIVEKYWYGGVMVSVMLYGYAVCYINKNMPYGYAMLWL